MGRWRRSVCALGHRTSLLRLRYLAHQGVLVHENHAREAHVVRSHLCGASVEGGRVLHRAARTLSCDRVPRLRFLSLHTNAASEATCLTCEITGAT